MEQIWCMTENIQLLCKMSTQKTFSFSFLCHAGYDYSRGDTFKSKYFDSGKVTKNKQIKTHTHLWEQIQNDKNANPKLSDSVKSEFHADLQKLNTGQSLSSIS